MLTFYSFSPLTSKMRLELIASAKFDAFHSNSLLAFQVVSVSIVGYTT